MPIGALALLVLNDHFLKHAGVLPGWLTGKLSDFAGVTLLPVLAADVAMLLGVEARRALWASFVIVGALYAAIKCIAPLNEAYVAASGFLLRPFGYSASSVADVTDLLALAVLPAVFLWANRRSASSAEQAAPPAA